MNSTSSDRENGEKFAHLFVFSGTNKAGMDEADKAKQAQIIYDMSKESSFFKHAQEQDDKTHKKIVKMKEKMANLSVHQHSVLTNRVHHDIEQLEKRRNFANTCVVIDMDMFFAAVAIRDRPEIAHLPVAVGGAHMISTTNYVARKYGVRSAMPGFIGKKLCPELIFVPHEGEKYAAASRIARDIISQYDPNLTSHSLDEFFFNITDYLSSKTPCIDTDSDEEDISHSLASTRATAESLVQQIRHAIFTATGGLTCSAGIAHNFALAKMAADVNKPNGQCSVPLGREALLDFLDPLKCRKITGVGKVMEKMLAELEITTIGDLRNQLPTLKHLMSEKQYTFLLQRSLGLDSYELREEGTEHERKSISVERTFAPLSDEHSICEKLKVLCGKLVADMASESLKGSTVVVKIKTTDFVVIERSVTLGKPTNNEAEMYKHASNILKKLFPMNIRLLGVGMMRLVSTNEAKHTLKSYFKQSADLQENLSEDLKQSDNYLVSDCSNFSEASDALECPVCSRTGWKTVDLLTVHIENCLRNESSAVQSNSDSRKRKSGESIKAQRNSILQYVAPRKAKFK